mgnify:CR=1 FL=1
MDEEEKKEETPVVEEQETSSEEDEDIKLFEESEKETSKEEKVEEEKFDSKKIEESLEEVKREQRISDFLNDPRNEDYKEFAGKIRELAKQPQAKGLTVEALANLVVPKDYWLKKGAELAKQAEQESSASFSGGRSTRDISGGQGGQGLPDPSSLSSKEFEKKAWEIARGSQP